MNNRVLENMLIVTLIGIILCLLFPIVQKIVLDADKKGAEASANASIASVQLLFIKENKNHQLILPFTVDYNEQSYNVYVNGEEYIEPYITEGVETYATNFHDLTVPEGTIFVMGDNRTGSKDSREFGCIPMDKIEGKVKFRMWPLDVFGKIE